MVCRIIAKLTRGMTKGGILSMKRASHATAVESGCLTLLNGNKLQILAKPDIVSQGG